VIEGLKPYAEMKDSGVPWLGQIPAHWECQRNGRLFAQRNETGFSHLPILEVSLRTGVQVRDFDSSNRKQIMADGDLYKRAAKGDIAYNTMRMWQGAVGIAPVDGLVSPAYIVARPLNGVQAHYYEYLFRTTLYTDQINRYSRGIVSDRNRLYWEDFKQMPSPVPPSDEQTAIVRFLGQVDRRIARYIGAKQKLIKLLEEQRHAIVHHAVTHGLDSSAPLKPSRIERLGDIPEGWQIVPLRRLATKFGSGVTPRGGAQVYGTTGVPFIRSQNVHFSGLRLEGVARISRDLHEALSGTHVIGFDVLLNITGASIGRVCAVPANFVEGNVNQHVCIIRPRLERIRADYLAAFLSTPGIQTEIYLSQNGSSREGLTLQAIRDLPILVPTIDEQEQILSWILDATQPLAKAIEHADSEIALLLEYRTRLMADVVTGKLDVREAAARLRDESEEVRWLREAEESIDSAADMSDDVDTRDEVVRV
jgi:type I restriction enzyme, S subunit